MQNLRYEHHGSLALITINRPDKLNALNRQTLLEIEEAVATAMADAAVAESFKAKGITVMEGDWTRNDPAISAWLAEHKRAGVPVYVYYDPTGGETELPQILTVDALTTLKV